MIYHIKHSNYLHFALVLRKMYCIVIVLLTFRDIHTYIPYCYTVDDCIFYVCDLYDSVISNMITPENATIPSPEIHFYNQQTAFLPFSKILQLCAILYAFKYGMIFYIFSSGVMLFQIMMFIRFMARYDLIKSRIKDQLLSQISVSASI